MNRGEKAKKTLRKRKGAIKANFAKKLNRIIKETNALKKMVKKWKFY